MIPTISGDDKIVALTFNKILYFHLEVVVAITTVAIATLVSVVTWLLTT